MSLDSIFEKLKMGREPQPAGPVDFIIVGLGNPGSQYENTRHNTGFMTIDTLAKELGVAVKKSKFKSLTADISVGGKRCVLMKPSTYMNNSGEAVVEALNFYKLSTENMIVIYDDISLDVGKMRIRQKGSAGGHNGMKSIICLTGSDIFPRVKVGVGAKPHPDFPLADWVLSPFKNEEGEALEKALESAAASVKLIVEGKINEAMNKYNS